jgi:hypothetical protein
VDYIRSLMPLPLVDFESQIWNAFGHKYIDVSDRAKVYISTRVSLIFIIGHQWSKITLPIIIAYSISVH